MSYVMVRGSVPIFWEQKGYIEDVVITKSSEMTQRFFRKHFEDLINTYSDIYCVDLLSDTKAREIILTREYIKQISMSKNTLKEHIRFEHFDFHGFCSGDRYHHLKVLLARLT
jgi:synaptojanin